MASIGIDFGGTSIKIGLVEQDELLAVEQLNADAEGTLKSKLPELGDAIDKLIDQHSTYGKPQCVGLAFPGIVDSDRKCITSEYVKFTDAMHINLPQWAADRWGIPLAMENDARAALVGEWQYGAGKGFDNLVMCTLGTGFGSAALVNGRILKGAHYIAGNLGGHMIVNFEGDRCNCGAIGCAETEGSSWVLESRYRDHQLMAGSSLAAVGSLNFKDVFEHADRGDELGQLIRDRSIHAWCAAIFNLVHAFDPDLVIIGGGIMRRADIIIPRVREYIDENTWPVAGTYDFAAAVQPDYAGVLGMAYLASQEISSN